MKRRIDLLTQGATERHKMQQRIVGWAAVLGALVAVVAMAALSIDRQVAGLERQVAPLRDEVAQMRNWHTKVEPTIEQLETARERRSVVGRLLNEAPWSRLLWDVAQTVAETIELTALSTVKEQRETGEGKAPEEVWAILISGQSSSDVEVVAFMRRLAASGHVGSLELVRSSMPMDGEKGRAVSFQLRGIVK